MGKRAIELGQLARNAVAYQITTDLAGRTENFKELWEHCETAAEQEIVRSELRRILRLLMAGEVSQGRIGQ